MGKKTRIKSDASLLEDLIRKGYTAEEAQKILDQAPQATNQSANKFKFKSPIFQDAELEVEDFAEDVNDEELPEDDSLAAFAGDEDLTDDEVIKALQVVDGVADAVLEAQGKDNPDLEYEQVLDLIDDTLESEELPEEITNAVIDISVASDGTSEESDITFETADDANVIHGVDDTADVFEAVEATDDTEIAASVILSKTDKPDSCQIKNSLVRINSHWKDKDMYTKLAWDDAEKKVTEQLGHAPETPKDWATVAAIAKNKYKKLQGQEEEAYTEAAFASVRRVIRALKSSLQKIFSAGEPVANNNDDVNAPKPTPDTPAPDTTTKDMNGTDEPTDEGILGADPTNNLGDKNVEGGSGNVVLDFSDADLENGPIFEMELGDKENKEKLQFEEVTAGVAILHGDSKKVNTKVFAGKVYKHNDGTATVFLKSNVFGLVAVNGRFIQGIKNSVYEAFVRADGRNAVNSSAQSITLPGKEKFVISSVSSNRSVKSGKASCDIVASLESTYVKRLKQNNAYLDQRYRRTKQLHDSISSKLQAENKQLVAQSTQTSAEFQAKLDEQRFLSQMEQQHQAIQSSITQENRNLNKNIDFLSKLM